MARRAGAGRCGSGEAAGGAGGTGLASAGPVVGDGARVGDRRRASFGRCDRVRGVRCRLPGEVGNCERGKGESQDDAESRRGPEQTAAGPVAPGHGVEVAEHGGVPGVEGEDPVERVEGEGRLPAGEVRLSSAEPDLDQAGSQRRGGGGRVGQEGWQGLLRPIDAVDAERRGELIAHLGGAAGTGSRLVSQRGSDDAGQGLAHRRVHPAWVEEVARDQPPQRGGGIRGLEGEPPGAQPVEDGAEGEDVGALVGLGPLDDLGRHVVGGADQRTGHGHPIVLGQDARDAEVGELHRRAPAQLGNHDVLGLQVPVDDPRGVRVREGIGERHAHQCPALRERDARLVGEGAKRSTVDELGDQPALLGGVARVVEDLHDARVGQASDGAGLP